MNWQPIETAPKDGRHILLWFPGYQYKAWTAAWSGQGWRTAITGMRNRSQPTHWAPLETPGDTE